MKFLFPFLFFIVCTPILRGDFADSLSLKVEEYIDSIDPSIPLIDLIFEQNIIDVSICKGPNHTYYLTGTSGDKNGVQQGIRIWASYNMKDWNLVGNNGYVWTFENDGVAWQKEISTRSGWPQRGIISPEVHYLKNTFWITYTNSNSNQSGILESLSGKIQGPYEEVSGDTPLIDASHASLFMDVDSTVYFIYDEGLVYTMNTQMTGFASSQPQQLTDETGNRIGNCCVHLTRVADRYVLSASKWNGIFDHSEWQNRGAINALDARFDGVLATSSSLFGKYKVQSSPIPHAGRGQFFDDFEGNFWYTLSGEDIAAPVTKYPSFLPVKLDGNGEFISYKKYNMNANKSNQIVYVSYNGNNSTGNNWDNAYNSIQRAIENAPDGAQLWIAKGKYDAPIEIKRREGLYLYGGFFGNETEFNQRNYIKNQVVFNGKNTAKHVISVNVSSYIRIDGITIQSGNASGESLHLQYGGGVHIFGGGETIRLVNCIFENNIADQDGGAFYASLGAAPVLINCIFRNNVSKNNGGAAAVYCNSPNGYHTKFYNCIFNNNFAYGDGGAIYFDTNKKEFGLLSVINCLITNNTTLKEGGVLTLDRNSNLLLVNSTVCLNKGAVQGAVVGSLGKVPAKSRIVNSIFYQNSGGILFAIEGEAETSGRMGNDSNLDVWVQFTNCLFEDNEVYGLVQRNFDRKKWISVYNLNESIMGRNCLSGNPAFIDIEKGNFHLNFNSKAKPTDIKNYLFDYNLDNQNRGIGLNNLGCY